jgi:hypothetical protein
LLFLFCWLNSRKRKKKSKFHKVDERWFKKSKFGSQSSAAYAATTAQIILQRHQLGYFIVMLGFRSSGAIPMAKDEVAIHAKNEL